MQPRSLGPGTTLGEHRLIELLARDVWRAQHLTTSREVCVRVLARQVPSDEKRRIELVERIRKAAAIPHPAFPTVRAVDTADGVLYLVEDLQDATPLDSSVGSLPQRPEKWMKFAWQLASAIEALHGTGIVHGAVDGTTVLLDRDANLRLRGPDLHAMLGRREGRDAELLKRDLTPDQLACRSPEALTGQPLDPRSDVFSIGVLLYRVLTGVSPFVAEAPDEVVRRVLEMNPRNPRDLDPDLPPHALGVIGRCLFKKPSSRYSEARAILVELTAADPSLEQSAAWPREIPPGRAAAPEQRREVTNLLVADVPYFDLIEQQDPDAASRIAARMQQLLGESIYLHDGQVLDSLGHRVVAVIPDASAAVGALYRAIDELAVAMQGGENLEPRVLLVRGEIEREGLSARGPIIGSAHDALQSLAPGQVVVSDRVLTEAWMQPSGAAVGRAGDQSLYLLPARSIAATESPGDSTVMISEEDAAGGGGDAAEQASSSVAPRARPRRALLLGLGAAAILLIGSILLALLLWPRHDTRSAIEGPTAEAPAPDAVLVGVGLPSEGDFPEGGADVARRSAAALRRLLGGWQGVSLVDESIEDARRITFLEIPQEGDSVHIAMSLDGASSSAVSTADGDAAIRTLIEWAVSGLGLPAGELVPPQGAAGHFGSAALALLEGRVNEASTAAESATSAAPDWVPGWRLALEAHDARGDRAKALEAAEAIARLRPAEPDVRRRLAIAAIEDGDPADALEHATAILEENPEDRDALEIVGRYALSAADTARFGRAVERLQALPDSALMRRLHRGDVYMVAGDLDRAINQYFAAEEREPENAALAFKIGRVAALRGSFETAQLELDKLRRLDPEVGAHLVEAYILAQKRDVARIPRLLEQAQKNARWNDDVWTWSAEIWAKLGERRRVHEALERAVARSEATATIVLRQKPFFYLGYDERGERIMQELEHHRQLMKKALADVEL